MFNCKDVHLILHGGLGNQLFQYQAALKVAAQGSVINIYTFELDNYATKRHFELLPILLDNNRFMIHPNSSNLLIRSRLPKIIAFLFKKELILRVPLMGFIVDGYFINKNFYQTDVVENEIHSLMKKKISIPRQSNHNKLIHLRLTDFFSNSLEAESFVEKQILKIKSPVDIITDDENIVKMILSKYEKHKLARVISTENKNAWDVLKIMSAYKYISSNGSTLALWAGWLGSSEYTHLC